MSGIERRGPMHGKPTREETELIPVGKEFTWVRVTHQDDLVHLLSPWEQSLERQLQAKSAGNIAAFIELANGSPKLHKNIIDAHAQGIPYSLALHYALSANLNVGVVPSLYLQRSFEIVDQLDKRYPGRVSPILEQQNESVRKRVMMLEEKNPLSLPYDQRISFYQEYIQLIGVRDRQIIQQLDRILSSDAFIGGAGWIGSHHIGVIDGLADRGFTVEESINPRVAANNAKQKSLIALIRAASSNPHFETTKLQIKQALFEDSVRDKADL